MSISIENALLAVTIGSTGYQFNNVQNITIADPRENTLAVSPQGIGDGIAYRTGTTTPINLDTIVREVPKELHDLLLKAFLEQERIDVLLVDQLTEEKYEFSKSIIRNSPSNVSIVEGETAFDVPFNLACPAERFKYNKTESAI